MPARHPRSRPRCPRRAGSSPSSSPGSHRRGSRVARWIPMPWSRPGVRPVFRTDRWSRSCARRASVGGRPMLWSSHPALTRPRRHDRDRDHGRLAAAGLPRPPDRPRSGCGRSLRAVRRGGDRGVRHLRTCRRISSARAGTRPASCPNATRASCSTRPVSPRPSWSTTRTAPSSSRPSSTSGSAPISSTPAWERRSSRGPRHGRRTRFPLPHLVFGWRSTRTSSPRTPPRRPSSSGLAGRSSACSGRWRSSSARSPQRRRPYPRASAFAPP